MPVDTGASLCRIKDLSFTTFLERLYGKNVKYQDGSTDQWIYQVMVDRNVSGNLSQTGDSILLNKKALISVTRCTRSTSEAVAAKARAIESISPYGYTR